MTDLSQKKADIKKNIRSLLLSSPAALTPKELKSDYHGFIGEPIDFRVLGYVSFEDFLRDIDDVVCIGFKNGMMTLSAKADETTKHIQKLVSKQKVPNKKKYAVYRQRGGYGPPHRYQMPDRSRYPPRRQYQQLAPPQPVVPAFVRRQMGDLFRSFPDGVEVIYLEKAFMRVYGTGLNYQHYGFMNQYEFLQSMGDIIKVEEVRKGEWYVLPVEYRKKPEPLMSVNSAPLKTSPVQLDSQETIGKLNNYNDTSTSKINRSSKGRGRRRIQSGDNDVTSTLEVQSVGIISNSTPGEEALEREVQALLEKHSKGLWASSFAREYQALHGKPIIYKNLGHLSVVDLVASMPHIVAIRRPNPQGDWMLYDARNAPSQESSTRSRHTSGKAVETNIKDAIRDILYCHPNGVNIKNLPRLYKEYTSNDLPFKELGFNTAEDLFVSLADNYLQLSYSTSGIMLYPMNHDKLSPRNNVDIEQQISDDDSNIQQQQQHGLPHDVVGPGCHFIPVMLPDSGQYIELYVTNIVSPGLFWIMLRHKTKSLALEELMDRLDEVYRHNSDVYTMPESLMVPGQICAALFPEDNNWHRAVITGSNDEGFIKCYYVDYGNTNFVTKSHLKFLKTEFLTLPAQAVQARLANTQPPAGGKWKNKSKTRLLELTSHRPLVAYVFEVKEQKMSICLTDTSDPQVDIHINDVMVDEGLAQFIPDNETTVVNTTTHALEPDYSQVFGWNAVEVPRLPKVIQGQSGDEVYKSEGDENEYQKKRCYVKWIQLTDDYIIHLISLERVAYVLSSEISVLFWEDDVLTCMLKQRRVDIQKRVVGKTDYPELFNDLKNYNVSAVKTNDSEEKTFLSLYRLDCVPKILRVFDHDDENLLKCIEELVDKFDPDSPYWKSGNQTTTTTTISEEKCTDKSEDKIEDKSLEQSQDDDIDDLTLEDKQMALQTLQFKRKRVLQTMISNPDLLTDDLVNELNNYEIEIVAIKQQIKNQQNSGKTDSQSVSSKDDQHEEKKHETSPEMSENQRVIQNILNSSTKPIATANIMTQASTSTCTINPLTQLSQSGSQSGLINNSWMNQSITGNFPEFLPQSATGSSPSMTQSVTGSGDTESQSMTGSSNLVTQSMAGNSDILSLSAGSFPNFMQQSTGLFPGMLGVHGMPNPRLMNPALLNQAGMPCTGMGDLTNTMFPRGMGFGAGFQPGLLPQFNPLMMQCQGIGDPNMAAMPRNPLMPNIGRGQTLAQNILPGLLPLVQNLNLGRGSGS